MHVTAIVAAAGTALAAGSAGPCRKQLALIGGRSIPPAQRGRVPQPTLLPRQRVRSSCCRARWLRPRRRGSPRRGPACRSSRAEPAGRTPSPTRSIEWMCGATSCSWHDAARPFVTPDLICAYRCGRGARRGDRRGRGRRHREARRGGSGVVAETLPRQDDLPRADAAGLSPRGARRRDRARTNRRCGDRRSHARRAGRAPRARDSGRRCQREDYDCRGFEAARRDAPRRAHRHRVRFAPARRGPAAGFSGACASRRRSAPSDTPTPTSPATPRPTRFSARPLSAISAGIFRTPIARGAMRRASIRSRRAAVMAGEAGFEVVKTSRRRRRARAAEDRAAARANPPGNRRSRGRHGRLHQRQGEDQRGGRCHRPRGGRLPRMPWRCCAATESAVRTT